MQKSRSFTLSWFGSPGGRERVARARGAAGARPSGVTAPCAHPGGSAAARPRGSSESASPSCARTYRDGLKSFLEQTGLFHSGRRGRAAGEGSPERATINQGLGGERRGGDAEAGAARSRSPAGREEPPPPAGPPRLRADAQSRAD